MLSNVSMTPPHPLLVFDYASPMPTLRSLALSSSSNHLNKIHIQCQSCGWIKDLSLANAHYHIKNYPQIILIMC